MIRKFIDKLKIRRPVKFNWWLVFILIVSLVCLIFFVSLQLLFQPSHNREWELGQEVLPKISLAETGEVTIEGFRNFDWLVPEEDTIPNYETRQFNLEDITSVDVFISHFDDFEGLAHIFLSFGLSGDEPVVVSFETRREVGEQFSPVLGILRQFEIVYVVGAERDVVGLRTDVRGERVYLYPTKANQEQSQALFLVLAEDINRIYDEPKMYNTLLRNCTNEITRRVENIANIKFPFTYKSILPGYFDEVMYDLGVIDTTRSFIETKQSALIDNESVDKNNDDFSLKLRVRTE
jgi:hypothetical protein